MLSTTQLDHYHTQGFVIPDFRLDKETLDTIKGHHERLITRLPEFRDYCPSVLAYDLAFLNFARIPEILEMVEQVLGGHFALWNSSFFAKPAINGRLKAFETTGFKRSYRPSIPSVSAFFITPINSAWNFETRSSADAASANPGVRVPKSINSARKFRRNIFIRTGSPVAVSFTSAY